MECSNPNCGREIGLAYVRIGDLMYCCECGAVRGYGEISIRSSDLLAFVPGASEVIVGVLQADGRMKVLGVEKPEGFDELPRAVQNWQIKRALDGDAE